MLGITLLSGLECICLDIWIPFPDQAFWKELFLMIVCNLFGSLRLLLIICLTLRMCSSCLHMLSLFLAIQLLRACLVHVDDVRSRLCSYQIAMRHVIFSTWESSSPSRGSTWYSLSSSAINSDEISTSLRYGFVMECLCFRFCSLWISVSLDLIRRCPTMYVIWSTKLHQN